VTAKLFTLWHPPATPKEYGEVSPLFRDRVPVAAANQLAIVLAWLTECDLATLEGLEGMSKVSKRELERQRFICDTAVRHCFDLGVQPVGLEGRRCTRLEERLKNFNKETNK